jgi:hypothetical protein
MSENWTEFLEKKRKVSQKERMGRRKKEKERMARKKEKGK